MTNPKFWQDHEFNPEATFIVAGWLPGFTHKGYTPKRGTVFDKDGVRPDRLRSLYESRWIRMAEPGELARIAPTHTDLMVAPEAIDAVIDAAEKTATATRRKRG